MAHLALAIVTPRFWPLVGDETTHLLRLAEALIAAGHEVSVVTPRWKRTWPERMAIGPVPLVRLRGSAAGGWGTLRWMYALSGWLAEERLDGVLVHGMRHEAYVALGWSAKSHVPTLLLASEDDLAWHRSAALGRRIAARCQQARLVIAPNELLAEELAQAGLKRECISVVPRSVNIPPARTPKAREEARLALATANYDLATTANAQVALAIGRLDAAHQFGDLVRAWRIVTARRPEARLWIVGDGPDREKLYRQIGDLDQRFRAFLPGTFDCIEELLQASDMLLYPAQSLAPPLVMREAQAPGLPVIAADSPGARQCISSQQTGVLYPPGDIKALAYTIIELMENPAIAVAYGAAAREAAIGLPSPPDEAAEYVSFIQHYARKT
jgi:glycosyltransferase involved in cell wall biosynthesis